MCGVGGGQVLYHLFRAVLLSFSHGLIESVLIQSDYVRQRPCKYADIPFCVVSGMLSLSERDMFISVPTGSLVKSAVFFLFFFFPKFPPDTDRLCQPHAVSETYFKRQDMRQI